MSGNTPKAKLEGKPDNCIIIDQPAVRNFSTGGGHGPEDTLVEGDEKLVTRKWQGYPPQNLNLIGKPHPPMPEVGIPRLTGKAEYANRVVLPNMLYIKLLTNPHPRAKVKMLDVSTAEKMPGVAFILTAKNAPKTYPLPDELFFQGEVVAIVAAETEDLAEDAASAIRTEYELLPFSGNLEQAMAANAPDLASKNRPSVIKTLYEWGEVDKAFTQSDVVKEFTYSYRGSVPVPLQPIGCVAKWDGDKLTVWGTGQNIYPSRATTARRLGIPVENVRFINKWNGGTFGGADAAGEKFYAWIAFISKQTGRPAKMVLPKDQELAQLKVKPETLSKFKVGATKDGKIVACHREFHVNTGVNAGSGVEGTGGGRSELYLHVVPNWREVGFLYRTNSDGHGSAAQQLPAGVQVGLGTDDGRNGRSRGHGPGEVPSAERAEARNESRHQTGRSDDRSHARNRERIPALRLLCLGRSAARRREGHRMGQEESRARRKSWKVQARDRHGHVPASRRTRWLPGR